MSRRSVLWEKKIRQGDGNVDKLLPITKAKGEGKYLKGMKRGNGRFGGSGKGSTVTEPMSPEKEQRIRKLSDPKVRRKRSRW